jgi:hypothetical protein
MDRKEMAMLRALTGHVDLLSGLGQASARSWEATAVASAQATARLAATYAAFARGEIAPLADLLAPEVVGHEYGPEAEPRECYGRDALLRRLADVAFVHWDAAMLALETLVSTGTWLAAVATWQATSRCTGLHYALQHVLVARLDDQGRWAEVWLIYQRPRVGDD